MPILLKSPGDLERMRASGEVVADIHTTLQTLIVPGITTRELDAVTYGMIAQAGGSPSFLGYHGYPASICASVNAVVLHGIPNDEPLSEGDIISIDLGVHLDGFHGDAAVTYPVGAISAAAQKLINVTEGCFWAGYEVLREGNRLGDAAAAVQSFAETRGFGVIREYTGHGIGRQMHEEPSVPNFGRAGSGPKLRSGMTLAVEPMICTGSPDVVVLADGWTVVMADGGLAAHFEHTVAISEGRATVLTKRQEAMI